MGADSVSIGRVALAARDRLRSRPGQAAALVVITLAAYLPALWAGYVWDDDRHVYENQTLRSGGGLGDIWFDARATPQYYPLVHSTFWLEYRLWGARPAGYHATNVLLHALGAVLLWRVLARLGVPGAWLAAAVFAVHPVHVESVAWVSERKNVLSGVFYLGSGLAYLGYAMPGSGGPDGGAGRRLYVLSLVLFICALLSKTVTCTLPVAVLLVLWWKRGAATRRDVLELLPFFVIGAAFGLNTAWLEREQVGAVGSAWDLSLVERAVVAGRALWFYAGKLAWPRRLTFVYPRWRVDAGSPGQYLPVVGAVACVLALWAGRRRLGRGAAAGVGFFVVSLAPALGFFAVYPMRFSFVADHFQYLASVGLIALGIASAVRLAGRVGDGRTVPWTVAGAALLAALGMLTFCQARAYRDERTLWEDTLVKNPSAWMAHNNLGPLLFDAGEAGGAAAHLEEALRLNPELYEAHVNLARVLESLGEYEDAEEHYRAALDLKPDHAQAHNNLGCLLRARYRLDEAVEHFGLSIDARPDYEVARRNLALTLGLRRAAEASVAEGRRAVDADPGDASARARLGVALMLRGRLDEAEEELRRALEADPELAEAHSHLGRLLAARGRREEAVVEFRWALALQPDHADAQRGLDRLLGSEDLRYADVPGEGQGAGGSAGAPAAP